ncbi:glycosyltransferase family 2 protein [Brevundimonas goettingensis]|nr:glycosyltransferase family 2 protein [Brevundimonas goettingensis]
MPPSSAGSEPVNDRPARGGPAIVTTLRDAGPLLDRFIAWHVAAGFARLYLVFDDPADPDAVRVASRPGVTVIVHDGALREAWTAQSVYAGLADSIDTEVMARQILNAAVVMDRARRDGCSWLLHIDIDELFWSPNQSVADHFSALEAEPFDVVTYRNLEAAPEADEIDDPMGQVTLFKVPPERLPTLPQAALRQALQASPRFRTGIFNLYSNGKSAARLDRPGLEPFGVHDFGRPQAGTARAISARHFILHYACCGFQAFLAKYRRLGRFQDRWWGRYDIAAAIGPFHLQARDVIMTGDEAAALAFYRARVAIENPAEAERLLAAGVLERIIGPARLLRG